MKSVRFSEEQIVARATHRTRSRTTALWVPTARHTACPRRAGHKSTSAFTVCTVEASLSVKRIRRKKLVRVGIPQPRLIVPNQEWSLDFVCDAVAGGRTTCVLSVVDTFTRECLAPNHFARSLQWATRLHWQGTRW